VEIITPEFLSINSTESSSKALMREVGQTLVHRIGLKRIMNLVLHTAFDSAHTVQTATLGRLFGTSVCCPTVGASIAFGNAHTVFGNTSIVQEELCACCPKGGATLHAWHSRELAFGASETGPKDRSSVALRATRARPYGPC
jgi:hypothetical protein